MMKSDDPAPDASDTRREPDQKRLARNMGELLQELRVAQTGVQILFAFLLSVAFTPRFAAATGFQRTTMIVTVLLTTVSTALLMAPAAWHRRYFRKGRRADIIDWGSRVAVIGLVLLGVAITSAVLLVASEVVGQTAAIVLAACVAVVFAVVWFALPMPRRRR